MGETPTPIAPCKKAFDFSKLSLVLKVPADIICLEFLGTEQQIK
jgi:hypothetical protein